MEIKNYFFLLSLRIFQSYCLLCTPPPYGHLPSMRGGGLYCFCLSPFTKGEISFLNLPLKEGEIKRGGLSRLNLGIN